MPEPRPAPPSTSTWCPESTRALTPPGTSPTRYSWSLISRTVPTSMGPPPILAIDLRSLEGAAEVDVDGLPFREDVQGLHAGLAVAVAGALGAPERKVRLRPDGGRVD